MKENYGYLNQHDVKGRYTSIIKEKLLCSLKANFH